MDPVVQMLVMVSGILLLGAFGEHVFSRTGIPDVVWLVGTGILLGPVLGVVPPELLRPIVPFFGAIALTVILAGGGYRLRFAEVAAAAPRGLLLAALEFVLAVVGIFAFLWLATALGVLRPTSPWLWILIGAILGGTCSTIIMPAVGGGRVDARTARLLEVESSVTDILCIVVAMAMIDLVVRGSVGLAHPLAYAARQIGIGAVLGLVAAALVLPLVPRVHGKPHGYTVLLALALILYALTQHAGGNGSIAVLTTALVLGNAPSLVTRFAPHKDARVYQASEFGLALHDQLVFFVKSFFFVLIGLMFPATPRLIALGAVATLFLAAFRIPAVRLATRGLGLSRQQRWLLSAAVPRGLTAGVLSALPLHAGIPGLENLVPGVFAVIVWSILVFAIGFGLAGRLGKDETAPPATAREAR